MRSRFGVWAHACPTAPVDVNTTLQEAHCHLEAGMGVGIDADGAAILGGERECGVVITAIHRAARLVSGALQDADQA